MGGMDSTVLASKEMCDFWTKHVILVFSSTKIGRLGQNSSNSSLTKM